MGSNNNNAVKSVNQARSDKPTKPSQSSFISVEKLLKKEFDDDEFIIDGILPRGSLCLLSARPKAGKTNLALQMATCIASGRLFLGRRTKREKVLFISLELNQKQMKKRLLNVVAYYAVDTSFQKFPFVLRFSSDERGIEVLKRELEMLKEKYGIEFGVVFIDTYVLFKDIAKEASKYNKSVYELESEYLAKIRKFCEETGITIVLIYHNRKSQAFAGDITENIMGSVGIAGAVNEIFLLERKTGSDEAKLSITGHNVEEQTIDLLYKDGIFELMTATKKELSIAEKIDKYLRDVGSATIQDIQNHLREIGATKDKALISNILKKFDIENNEVGLWKHVEETNKAGRAKKIYYPAEKEEDEPEQKQFPDIETEKFEMLFNEDLEVKEEDLEWLNEQIE